MVEDLIESIGLKLNRFNKNTIKNNSVLKCYNLIKEFNDLDIEKFKPQFNELKKTEKSYYKLKIFQNDIFELILIKWDKDFSSIAHYHPHNGCVLKVLEGEITEDRYFNDELYKKTVLKKNDVGFMHDIMGSHKITACETSFTLHLYSPPNFYN